jgi:hypothetical protein
MNSANFKWMMEQEILNLLHSSSLIMDNAPYHWQQDNKPIKICDEEGNYCLSTEKIYIM